MNVDDPLINKSTVAAMLGYSLRQVTRFQARPDFPKAIFLSDTPCAPRWRKSEIEAWIAARAAGGRR